MTPLVTGTYQIKTINGMTKLEGALKAIDTARPMLPRMVRRWGRDLRGAWGDLREISYLGRFMTYKVVSDLRWTPVRREANDILKWASAGPRATAGLGLVAWGRQSYLQAGFGHLTKWRCAI